MKDSFTGHGAKYLARNHAETTIQRRGVVNVYMVLLGKFASLHSESFEKCALPNLPAPIAGPWVAMGHFDAMYAYQLEREDKNPFQVIGETNRRIASCSESDSYFHPLYLLSEQDDSRFWEQEASCFATARIHFSTNTSVNDTYNRLMDQLMTNAPTSDCICRCYRTIELSDMILAVKSNCFQDLLLLVLSLRKYADIGKVYTYCGISYAALQDLTWSPEERDRIALFSMRFSVSHFDCVKGHLNMLQAKLGDEPLYSVVGVDDIAVTWKDLPLKNAVKLYRTWFSGEAGSVDLGSAFSEVITRVGISLDKIKSNDVESSQNGERLPEICQRLLVVSGRLQKLADDLDSVRYGWIAPLSELTRSLVRMSKTSVLDEFVYLMFPGVYSFLHNIDTYLERLHDRDIVACRSFVENWAHLMEHIMRIEGQLAHAPDMRPILYDIPVAMLEYTLAFLDRVVEVLQLEDNPQTKTCFLLVPHLCGRIEAQELFPAGANCLPRLVLVTIPLSSLYNPQEVQWALCHEASHYVGEKHRMRGERRKKYVQAATALMVAQIFEDPYPAFIEFIQDQLMEATERLEKFDMRLMQSTVEEWLYNLCSDKVKFDEFVRELLLKNSHLPRLNVEKIHLDQETVVRFSWLLNDLSILFRETYADICMLYLLSIDSTEYIQSLLSDLTAGNRPDEERRYEQFAIRIYVCLTAAGRVIPYEDIRQRDPRLHEEIDKIRAGLDNGNEDLKRLFPLTSIRFLQLYVKKCYNSLSQHPTGSRQLTDIRSMFANVASPDMVYTEFITIIDDYRKKILESY